MNLIIFSLILTSFAFGQNWTWKIKNNSEGSENLGSSKHSWLKFDVYHNGYYRNTNDVNIWLVYIRIITRKIKSFEQLYESLS